MADFEARRAEAARETRRREREWQRRVEEYQRESRQRLRDQQRFLEDQARERRFSERLRAGRSGNNVIRSEPNAIVFAVFALILIAAWIFIKFAPWILAILGACLFGIGGKKLMEGIMPKSSESSWQSLLALMLALVAGFIGYSKGLDIQKEYPLDSPPAREKKVEKSNTSLLKSPEPPKDTYQSDNSTSKDSQPVREKAVLDGKDFNQERESEDAHGSVANTYPPIDAQIHQAPELPSVPSDASEDASKDSSELNHSDQIGL